MKFYAPLFFTIQTKTKKTFEKNFHKTMIFCHHYIIDFNAIFAFLKKKLILILLAKPILS